MSRPVASVLLPVYNGAEFIETSIRSILDQSYPDRELIVIDDGSTDETPRIIEQFGSNVRVVTSRENEGISTSLNKAMTMARGDYVFFQTSDDVSHQDRIKIQIDEIIQHRVDAVACIPSMIGDTTSEEKAAIRATFTSIPGCYSSVDWFKRLFFNGNFVCAPSVAFRRDVWDSVGGANASLIQMQDFEYWLRVAMSGFSLHLTDVPLVSFRWHGRNLSHSTNDARTRREMTSIYRWVCGVMSVDHVRSLFETVATRIASYQEIRSVDQIPREVLLPLVLIRHRLSFVRQMGYEGILSILESATASALLKSHTGIDRKAAMELLLKGE